MRISKYRLKHMTLQALYLPTEATILTVQVQDNTIMLWVLHNDDVPVLENRTIAMYESREDKPSENIPSNPGTYIGTVKFGARPGTPRFAHVFEQSKQ